jgi:hypothetical protein
MCMCALARLTPEMGRMTALYVCVWCTQERKQKIGQFLGT